MMTEERGTEEWEEWRKRGEREGMEKAITEEWRKGWSFLSFNQVSIQCISGSHEQGMETNDDTLVVLTEYPKGIVEMCFSFQEIGLLQRALNRDTSISQEQSELSTIPLAKFRYLCPHPTVRILALHHNGTVLDF